MKSVLVTGVSTGIGRGIATVLGEAGWRVYGSVRKAEDAAAFEAALAGKGTALDFDVTDEAGIAAAAARLDAELGDKGLDALINNAGISVNGPLQHVPLDRMREQLEVNVVGLVAVTQAFLPLLGAREPSRKRPGKIINISSVAGRRALPFFGPYAASKHAVEAITDSLRRELIVYGIDVITIQPGPIQSEIWGKALEAGGGLYSNTAYAPALANLAKVAETITDEALPAEDVGKLALRILESSRPKTRYIIRKGGAREIYFTEMLPDRMVDKIIAKRLGLKRRK